MNDMGETSRLREEIEALRAQVARLKETETHDFIQMVRRAEAAEKAVEESNRLLAEASARAARLEVKLKNALDVLHECRGYVLNVLDAERKYLAGRAETSSSIQSCERTIANIDAARSAVSGGGG